MVLVSRTHKTKPFWVKMKQGHLATAEHHDHRDGVCDLPEEIDARWYMRSQTTCHYEFAFTGIHTCCCALCHGDYSWFAKKRNRMIRKRECKEWDKEYES